MQDEQFDGLCRDVGRYLSLRDPAELTSGCAWVGGERCALVCSPDFDDMVHLVFDLGALRDAFSQTELYRNLLICNLGLSAELGESFVLHEQSGHVLLRACESLARADPYVLALRFLEYSRLIQALRRGPLNLLDPSVEPRHSDRNP